MQADVKEQLNVIFSRYTGRKDELLPLLEDVQHKFGYLSEEVLHEISRFIKVPEGNVFGVATFYSEFTFRPPQA